MSRAVLVLCVAGCVAAWSGAATFGAETTTAKAAPTIDANTYLTMQELKKCFDEGQFLLVAQQITKIQANKRILDQYTLGELLALKGEALFRTAGYAGGASDAMKQAAKETKDATRSAELSATALLFKRAVGQKYTPKAKDSTGKAPGPFDLTDMKQRKDALTALLADELAAAEPAIRAGVTGTSLVPVANAAKLLDDLRTLELAATGADTKTLANRQALAGHAADLMTSAVETMGTQTTQLDRLANTPETYYELVQGADGKPMQVPRQKKRGLGPQEIEKLRAISRDADRIVVAVKELTELLHTDGKGFEKISPAATRLSAEAKRVASADYSAGTYVPPRR